MKQKLLFLLMTVLACINMHAGTVRVFGYLVGDDNRSIEGANVYSGRGADIVGTATNKNGFYELVLNAEDTIVMTYSMVGYTTVVQRIIKPQEVTQIDVTMMTDEQWLSEVEVRGQKHQVGTLDAVDAEATRLMPDATGGSIESILITFAGVNQNNELSSQYNVRGGTFDENVVYVNGIEIHRPLLYRSGQQEGLSFVNPYMVERVNFSAGGFDAQYGDKMSSVLDIEYKTPTKAEGNITASLLGGSVYFGHGNKRFTQMHGLRYKTNRYMLGALGGKGNYNPNYPDYQTMMSWSLNSKKETSNNDWRMTLLANVSRNDYTYQPESYAENWGGTDHSSSLDIWYDGQEKDLFLTTMGALGVSGHVSKEVKIGFNVNGFYASEQENYDISAEYELSGDGDSFGTGNYHNHARNKLTEGVLVGAHTGEWTHRGNTLRWGISGQGEWIQEQVREWQWRDSAGYSMPTGGKDLELYYAMRGTNSLNTYRMQGYIQNTHEWNTTSAGKWILTAGMRLQYWSGNREWMPSPRASLTWLPGWKRDVAIRVAGGLYYQAPFYKELRDTATTSGVTRVTLNRNIKAQRSAQAVVGVDYYFRGGGRPFKLSGEAYYKYIDRMESYTVDNVRVQYSGENDAKGYTVGADLKLYGEMVPGADSWISVGWMHSKMKILDHPEYGWLSSPQEQRFSFSMFFQDYIPKLPQLRFHLKMIFAENLPFAVPRKIWTIQHAKMSLYKRIDIGATYQFDRKTTRFMRAESAKHIRQWAIGLECFNLVGWNNVSDYFWVQDERNRYWRCPNYLTGRRINLKITIDFQ